MQPADIREELKNRIAAAQKEIHNLEVEKDKINKELRVKLMSLSALQVVYENESKRFGEHRLPLFTGKGKSYRFAGMRLVDALAIIRQEHPEIDKRQALKILEKEGFDFKGKRHLSAVHFAWVALNRRKKR